MVDEAFAEENAPDPKVLSQYVEKDVLKSIPSNTLNKIENVSSNFNQELHDEYNRIKGTMHTDKGISKIKNFKQGISWFKNLDTKKIKELRDRAGITKEELRTAMHQVVGDMDDEEGNKSYDNFFARKAINLAMSLKGLKNGGFYEDGGMRTQYGMGGAPSIAPLEMPMQPIMPPQPTVDPQLTQQAPNMGPQMKEGGFKYAAGGVPQSMYGNITPGMGNTSSIVFQEQGDERLQNEEKELSKIESDETWKNAAILREQKQASTDQVIGTSVKTAQTGFNQWAKQKGFKDWGSYLADKAANKVGTEVGTELATTAGTQIGKTAGTEMATSVGKDAVSSIGRDVIGSGITTDIGGSIINTGADVASMGLKTAGTKGLSLVGQEAATGLTQEATKGLLTKGLETGTKELGKTALSEVGKTAATEVGKEATKGLLASSVNPSPYATAANLIGKGVSMASDDQDATTWNTGEATGDILGSAGEYAGYGAMLGSIVPGVGNLAGAVVGGVVGASKATIEGIANRRKAKGEEQEQKDKISVQRASRDAEFFKKKRYSGFDFGSNLTNAEYGGYRMRGGGARPLQQPRAMDISRY